MKTIDLASYKFAPVVCNNTKRNGFRCNQWLGAVDTSKPCVTVYYCKVCKINYVNEVDDQGIVHIGTTKERIESFEIPVRVKMG
jgi:hypothetical protein